MSNAWTNRLMGAAAMYLLSGIVTTVSLMVHVKGPCPWWLPPYWVVTWLFQVVLAIFDVVAY